MKIVFQWAPDPAERVLSGLEKEAFIVDQDTYFHFRDEVFIKGVEKFIRKTAPGKWKEMENLEDVEKVKAWHENQRSIYKYYSRFKRHQKIFHLYKNGIYFYKLIGFANVGNEIQLMKLDMEDVIELLNRSTKSVLKKLLHKIRGA